MTDSNNSPEIPEETNDTTNDTVTLTATNIHEALTWCSIPNHETNAKIAQASLDNGFALLIQTNPVMSKHYKIDIFTVYMAGVNKLGKIEPLADYEPYEYIGAEMILVMLDQMKDLEDLDPVEESELFLSGKANGGAPRKWYDLAGKLEDFTTGAVNGMSNTLDKIGANRDDEDD